MSAAPDFGPAPAPDLRLEPSPDEIGFFAENGYLVVDQLTTEEELDWVRSIMDWIFQEEQGSFGPVDRSGDQDPDASPTLRQAFFPEIRFPALLETTFVANARRYAAALLHRDVADVTAWGHMLLKPARTGRAALWHQDAGYWEPEYDYHALGCWLPLHDVSVDQGAMQFVPGSHKRGLRDHRHVDAPEFNVLEVVDSDVSGAVACPLAAGGATFHHFCTLHYTAPNTTDRDRYAFPIEYQTRPTPRPAPRSMPWADERRAATGGVPDPILYVADGVVEALPTSDLTETN